MAEQKYEVQESESGYERSGDDLLREALKRTHKERFLMATRLYKIQMTMQKAVITRKPYRGK